MSTDTNSTESSGRRERLERRGIVLEAMTLSWNIVGVLVLAVAAASSRSVGLVGFGLDSLVEIGASTVVIWELTGRDDERTGRALRLIGFAFAALAVYLLAQSVIAIVISHRPSSSPLGIAWTSATALAMYALAFGKSRVGSELGNPVLVKESRVTVIDGTLALAVLVGLILTARLGWWWVDSGVGLVLAVYALREAIELLRSGSSDTGDF